MRCLPLLFLMTCATFNMSYLKAQSPGLPKEPYEPLQWININPEWYESVYGQHLVSEHCDGYNFYRVTKKAVKPIVYEGNIYTAYSIKDYYSPNYGIRIESRSLNDGFVNWYNEYSLPENEKLEMAVSLSINENQSSGLDELVLIGLKRKTPYLEDGPLDYPSSTRDTRMTFRTLNLADGTLLKSNMPDFEDSIYEQLYFFQFERILNTHFFYDEEEIRYILKKDVTPDSIITFVLNESGIRITERDTILGPDGYFQDYSNVMATDSGYLQVLGYRDASGEIFFNYYSKDFVLEKSIAVDTFTMKPAVILMGISDERVLLKSYIGISPITNETLYEVALYDRQGHLIREGSLEKTGRPYSENFEPIMWQSGNDIYLMATSYNVVDEPAFDFFTDILKANDNGSFDVVKRLRWENSKRLFLPREIYKLEDGSFLIYIFESNTYLQSNVQLSYDFDANTLSFLKLSASDLGLTTATTEISKPKTSFEIGPNPASRYLNVSFTEARDGIYKIYNANGQLIQSLDFYNSDYLEINLLNVEAGNYIISIEDITNTRSIESKQFIVIR